MKIVFYLSAVDVAFADFCARKQPSDEDAWYLAALVSHQYRAGHACLMLAPLDSSIEIYHANKLRLPGLSESWRLCLSHCPWWQITDTASPMVCYHERLYLRRAWQDERMIESQIQARLQQTFTQIPSEFTQWLLTLFPVSDLSTPNWQAIACALTSRRHISLITGGPGTGKTTTVVRLLALLYRLQQHHDDDQQYDTATIFRIGLSAPTGKAAARLASAIHQALVHLPEELMPPVPVYAQTLHRWLADAQLMQLDVLIVDEASMIDLHMMARLLRQLPINTRLVLLGDKDQLASVDAGAVLGQLCRSAEAGCYDTDTVAWLAQYAQQAIPSQWQGKGDLLAQQTVMLRHSYRFDAHSEIGHWAHWVNRQATQTMRAEWQQLPNWSETTHAEVSKLWLTPSLRELKQLILSEWKPRLQLFSQPPSVLDAVDAWASDCLQALSHFQLLCATREGPLGLITLNNHIAQWLGLAPAAWSVGRAVMVTRNNYTLELMNGDVGLCLAHPQLGLRVAFMQQQHIRWILPIRLTDIEDAFAMSVHKSQGSEFDRVALVLPEQDSPILTKELIYTAITRAKMKFVIATQDEALLWSAVARQVQRSGGLFCD